MPGFDALPGNTKEDVDALLEGLEAGVRMLRR